MLNAKSSRQVNRAQQEYKIKEREVKRSVRKDKRNFIESLASEAVNRTHKKYKIKEREVKRSVRKEKRNFIESLANEAEAAAARENYKYSLQDHQSAMR